MNHSGALEIRVAGIGRDTAFGRILNAVEEAERSRAPIQKTADKLAGYLVWFALACALLTFIITRNLTSTISVIIVAGACVGGGPSGRSPEQSKKFKQSKKSNNQTNVEEKGGAGGVTCLESRVQLAFPLGQPFQIAGLPLVQSSRFIRYFPMFWL